MAADLPSESSWCRRKQSTVGTMARVETSLCGGVKSLDT